MISLVCDKGNLLALFELEFFLVNTNLNKTIVMPRKNKTDRVVGRFSDTAMREAVLLVQQGMSIRQAAREKGLSFQTLARYVQKFRNDPDVRMCPNYTVNQFFTSEQENEICGYIITCAKMFYGLSRDDTRRLVYECAIRNKINIPEKWHACQSASLAWVKGFQKRHPILALRTPEGCSLSRATGFNKFNVESFFNKLEEVLQRHPAFGDGTRIFNLDETGTQTVQKSQKVFACKGVRQVSKATSAERGTLVTTCCIVGASGVAIPPAMIFPRVHFKDFMTNGAPPGTLGLAAKGGWMNTECFVQVINHFIRHTSSCKENPSLLIMDNHVSHLSIEAIDICKENGVTILTIPPHCTNKLQPLDVGVLKPFQTFYSSAIDSWMMSHPGQTFSIYNVASCVGIAYPRAMTPVNITNAFRKCGIFPFDRHIFNVEDFMPSSVTDREYTPSPSIPTLPFPGPSLSTLASPGPSTSTKIHGNSSETMTNDTSEATFLSPKIFRGFPKAKPRTTTQTTKRRKGKTMIATDTPEREELLRNKQNKIKPDKERVKKNIFKNEIKSGGNEMNLAKKSQRRNEEESESEDDSFDIELPDSSGGEDYVSEDEEINVNMGLERMPVPEQYVLVEFESKGKSVYYVGEVLSTAGDDAEIKFLRKSTKCYGTFMKPDVEDISLVQKNNIKMILPPPKLQGKTKRQQNLLKFEITFDSLDIR